MTLLLSPAALDGSGSARAKTGPNVSADLYEDALTRFTSGDMTGAIIQLKNVLQQNPTNLPARILIGRAHLALGDAESAEKELRRAQVEGGDEELLIVPLANATYLLERYDEVLAEFSVKGRTPDVEAGLQAVHGQAHLALLQIEKAEDAFKRVAELQPGSVKAVIGMARVYLARSEFHAASKTIQQAVDTAPDNFFAWVIHGRVLRRLGNPQEALNSFNRAIALEPDYVAARVARAMVLIDLNRHEELTEDLEAIKGSDRDSPYGAYIEALLKARQNDTAGFQSALQRADILLRGIERKELLRDPPKLLLAGIVNFALKNYNDAFLFMREHVQRDRFHAGSRSVLGRLLMRQGNHLDAVTHLQVAAKLSPQDAEIRRLLGMAYMRTGRTEEASAEFEQAIKLNPTEPTLQTVLALTRLQSGKRDEATAGLEQVLEENETAVRPGIMLALIMIRDKDFDGALDVSRRMVERDAENPVLYNLIGTALWAKGDKAAARENLNRAVTLDPNYLAAHRNLARLELQSGESEAAKARLQAMVSMPNAGIRPLMDLAKIAARERRFRDAISHLNKARELEPKNIRIQLKIIDMLGGAGEGDAALRDARKLRDRLPDNVDVMEKLGQVELAFGKIADAGVAFRRMANLTADNAELKLKVARYQLRAEDLEGAHETMKRALTVDDGHLPTLAEIINLEARLRRYEDALFRAAQVTRRFPKLAIGDQLRGDVYVRMRRFDDAALAYRDAIRRQPSGPLFVRQYLARRNAGIELPDLEPMETWVKQNPRDYATRRTLAAGYVYANKLQAAQTLYESLLKERPKDPVVLNNLAGLYLEIGDDRALEYAEMAHRLAPRQPQTLDTLGWVHIRQGRFDEGLKFLRDAYARSSREPTIRYHLAFALSQLGRTEEARTHLKGVLKAKNSGAVAADARRLLAELGG